MGKLMKLFKIEPTEKKKCGGTVHGYIQKRGQETFCIKIKAHTDEADAFEGYVMKLSEDEAFKLHKRLGEFLFAQEP